ncbi:MAG: hypothetical protein JKY33_02000 [Bacteroidia bacterium]|nr:hypothetical protein [Bacteroidia bacterium]
MKRIFIYVTCMMLSVTSLSSFAQDSVIEPSNDTTFVDTARKYNEIDLNLSQWAIFFLGGQATPKFESKFKHHFKSGKAIRLGFVFTPNDIATAVSQNDAGDTTNFISNEINGLSIIKLGLEWQRPMNNFTVFYGFDILGGQNESKTTFTTYRPDTVPKSGLFIKETAESSTENIQVGIVPFAGINYKLSNRISFNIQGGLNIIYNTGTTTLTNISNEVSNKTYSEINVEMEPIINNFSINFHF